MRIHWPICFLFYCFSMIVHAYPYQEVLPDGVRLSLVAEKLSDQTELLGSAPSSQLFPPASTLKVVTALAAKLELGDSFTFATSLSKANDDLVMSFSGDPTLTSKDLSNLLDQLKESGITEIKGNVWLDDAMFVGYDRAVGWPWDILGVCYSAPASAITLNENCVQASIYTQDNGKTRVFVPEHQPIHVSTSAITVSKSAQKAKHCDLDLIAHSSNQYELKGCLVKRDKPLPLKFAVQDPRAYTSRVVYTLLRQKGIKLHGQVLIGAPANGINTKLIASHHSKALPALLEEMLKRSDNLIADTLTKTLGHHFYIQPGSFRNGTEAIKQIIFANTSIDIKNAQLEDGSGLSRNNRISAASMADILRYIWKHDKELNLIAIMPKSGESGTLKYRQSMRKAPIKGQLIAKSGSLYGTYNMAGYGLDKNGKPNTLFVQFVSDYFPEKRDDNKPVIAPITRFEKLFYQDIVSFSQAIPKK